MRSESVVLSSPSTDTQSEAPVDNHHHRQVSSRTELDEEVEGESLPMRGTKYTTTKVESDGHTEIGNGYSLSYIDLHTESPILTNQTIPSPVSSAAVVLVEEEPKAMKFSEFMKSTKSQTMSDIVEVETISPSSLVLSEKSPTGGSANAIMNNTTETFNDTGKNSIGDIDACVNVDSTHATIPTEAVDSVDDSEYDDEEFDDRSDDLNMASNINEAVVATDTDTDIQATNLTTDTNNHLDEKIDPAAKTVLEVDDVAVVVAVDEEIEEEEEIEEIEESVATETSESEEEDSRYNLNSSSDSLSDSVTSKSSIASSSPSSSPVNGTTSHVEDVEEDKYIEGPETDSVEPLYEPTSLFSRRNSTAVDDARAAIAQAEEAQHVFSKGLSAR